MDSYGRFTAATYQSISDLTVSQGGTGKNTFTAGQVLIGDGSSSLKQLANVSSFNTNLASNATVSNLTSDVYGRVTSVTNQAISGLTVAQGGTGVSTFSSGQLIVGNGTGALQALANTGTAGTYGSANTIPSFVVNQQGQITSVSTATVAAPANLITGNTLSANVVYSSLTTVGTLTTLSVLGNIITDSGININGTGNITMGGGNVSGATILGGIF